MGEGKKSSLFVWFLTSALLSSSVLGAQEVSPALKHVQAKRFLRTEPLVLRASSEAPLEWVMVFWKASQAEDYDSLGLQSSDRRSFEGRLDLSGLPGGSLAYYLAYKAAGRIFYLPPDAPGSVFTAADAAPENAPVAAPPPPPAAAPAPKPFPLRLDGSADAVLLRSEDDPQASSFVHSHNLRLDYTYLRQTWSLKAAARLAYSSPAVARNEALDLPDLSLEAKAGNHTFRAGDLPISESEFTIGGSGRRGMDYELGTKALSLHVFTSATQQMRGFKGLGWPAKSGASLFGGSVGYRPLKSLALKAVFVSGEDDPQLGVNVGTDPLFHRRKGNVMAVIGEAGFLGDSLRFEAEAASSRYDPNLDDGEDLRPGKAFRIRSAFRSGGFDAQAGYRSIDADFNTIGQPFLVNDRRGFDAGAGFSAGRFRVSGSFRSDATNVAGDSELASAKLRQGRADVSLGFGASSSVRFGYVLESQDAGFSSGVWNPYPAFEGTLEKSGLSGGLDVGLASWLRFSLSGEKGAVRCALTPSMEGSQTAAMIGIQIMVPDRISLFPVLSYSRLEQTAAGTATRSMMASLNGELTLVRRWLTWNVMAALSDMDSGPGAAMTSVSADTGINLNLRPVLKLGDVIVSLRGQYMRSRMTGQTAETYRAAARLAYSF